jgi:hypothetical protein
LKDKNNLMVKVTQLEADKAENETREHFLKENLNDLKI